MNNALPINIKDLLNGKPVEWERLEFKEGSGAWTQITTNSNNVRLSSSSNFSDGDATTARLTDALGYTFNAGQGKFAGSDRHESRLCR